jgi:hypothetical protein
VSSEKIPIEVRNPEARRKGIIATMVGISSSAFMKTNVIKTKRMPVVAKPILKINALTKGFGPISVRVQ